MASRRDQLIGAFTNRVKGSSRQGQRFKVVTRGGQRGHLYKSGQFVPDKAAPTAAPAPAAGPRGVVGARWGESQRITETGKQPSNAPTPPMTPEQKTRHQGDIAAIKRSRAASQAAKAGTPAAAGTTPSYTTNPAARTQLMERAAGQGRFLNVAEQSPRYGQRFDIVRRRKTRYHRYGPGRLIADVKRGAGTARYKPPTGLR